MQSGTGELHSPFSIQNVVESPSSIYLVSLHAKRQMVPRSCRPVAQLCVTVPPLTEGAASDSHVRSPETYERKKNDSHYPFFFLCPATSAIES